MFKFSRRLGRLLMEERLYAGQAVPPGMSLNAFKRQIKQQKMEAGRDEFIAKRREKRRLAKQKSPHRRPKLPRNQVESGVTVVLDCGFDDLMEEGERTSLAGQLTRCYSMNRRAPQSTSLIVSGFSGRLKQRFDGEMRRTQELWKNVLFESGDYKPADPERAVYLTGDAEDVLDTLEPGWTYYVGGIVDKNRYTNLCLDKAHAMGVRAARLPIDEHIRVSGRRVLTTNQAFELLLKWLELRDWKLAFEAAIPKRKLPGQVAEPDAEEPSAEEPSAEELNAEEVSSEETNEEESKAVNVDRG